MAWWKLLQFMGGIQMALLWINSKIVMFNWHLSNKIVIWWFFLLIVMIKNVVVCILSLNVNICETCQKLFRQIVVFAYTSGWLEYWGLAHCGAVHIWCKLGLEFMSGWMLLPYTQLFISDYILFHIWLEVLYILRISVPVGSRRIAR